MDLPFSLRRLVPSDATEYGKLILAGADTGKFRVSQKYQTDPFTAIMSIHPGSSGVVAESPRHPGFVGAGMVQLGRCRWEGRTVPYGLHNTLVVHPAFRRCGVAAGISTWRESFAREQFGTEGGVTFGMIQQSNKGSELTARRWYRDLLANRLVVLAVRPRSRAPENAPQFQVRQISPQEMEEVSVRLNGFHDTFNLYPPETAESLARWCGPSVFDTPHQTYHVVSDRSGNILAGLGLTENARLRKVVVERMPPAYEFLNRLLKAVPLDRTVSDLGLSRFWFTPGQAEAARHLFETVRWECRGKGTFLMCPADRLSPIAKILPMHPWSIKTLCGVAVSSPSPASRNRPVYYA